MGEFLKDGVNGVDGLDDRVSGTLLRPMAITQYSAVMMQSAVLKEIRQRSVNLQQYLKDGVNGVDGLNEARTVDHFSRWLNLYVTAISDNAVSWFDRNIRLPVILTYGGRIKNGLNGSNCIGVPIDVKSSSRW